MVSTYLKINSYVVVKNEFRRAFPGVQPPNNSTIYRKVKKYLARGTSRNLCKENSGRPRTGRSQNNINAVQNLLLNTPRDISTRRNNLGISRATFNRIVRQDLKWHPYRIHIRHQLKNTDFPRLLQFCQWFLHQCQTNRFLANLVIGDEASFALNGKVNTHNVREYAPQGHPPSFNYDVNMSREKLTVWAALCGNGTLLCPFFFQGNVNGASYLRMIDNEVLPNLMRNYGIAHLHNLNHI